MAQGEQTSGVIKGERHRAFPDVGCMKLKRPQLGA
jgi:hypothetical protein